jgi:hypothetical protein
MMNKPLECFLAAIVLASATTCQGAPLGVIDQQNSVYTNNFFSGQNRIGQSFVPSLPGIDAIEFELGALTGGGAVFVNLRSGLSGPGGLDGPILGTSNSIDLPSNAPFEWRHFDFPSRIDLVPGNVYVAELVSGNGHAGRFTMDSMYAAGSPLPPTSFDPTWDLVFVEGLHVPEPSAGALAAGAYAMISMRRRRRRAACAGFSNCR